jgi:hypothetical protein
VVSDDTPTPDPGADRPPQPGERRLDRPPSDRYLPPPDQVDEDDVPSGSLGRALGAAALVEVAGVVAIVVLGGVLAFSAGLLVVAAVLGRAIGLVLAALGFEALVPPRRTWLAVALAVGGVLIGQLGLWWYAGTEGGVLGPVDYLVETYGVLVPLQVVIAAGFAWWAAR